MSYWSGKTVFLTGASSGIGAALAVALGKKGAVLGLAARRLDLLRVIAADVEHAGGKASIYECDVTNEDSVKSSVADFTGKFEHIDVLISNSGI